MFLNNYSQIRCDVRKIIYDLSYSGVASLRYGFIELLALRTFLFFTVFIRIPSCGLCQETCSFRCISLSDISSVNNPYGCKSI
jgi:hypothetical protein